MNLKAEQFFNVLYSVRISWQNITLWWVPRDVYFMTEICYFTLFNKTLCILGYVGKVFSQGRSYIDVWMKITIVLSEHTGTTFYVKSVPTAFGSKSLCWALEITLKWLSMIRQSLMANKKILLCAFASVICYILRGNKMTLKL